MKIALAQINTTVGDLAGNEAKILAGAARAQSEGADLALFPELTITGYPPRDLLLKRDFIAGNLAVLKRLAAASGPTALLVGYVGENKNNPGRDVTNQAALLQNGQIVATRAKTLLPTYDVFDEDRYFEPAQKNVPVSIAGQSCGVTICEDIWNDEDFWPHRRYRANPIGDLVAAGAGHIFNISASPWHVGKHKLRANMLASLARKSGRPVALCNLVGGNDELVFDGGSLVFNGAGELIAQGKTFEEDFVVVDTEHAPAISLAAPPEEEDVYRALVLGLRDYFHKCGFQSAVLGLSGGIDSAVVACLAVAALGADHVQGVSLPSQFSSQGSLDDARLLAKRLGLRYDVIPIQPPFESVKQLVKPVFGGRPEDTTEENMQARLRGVILMALSNKFGSLLLTTGKRANWRWAIAPFTATCAAGWPSSAMCQKRWSIASPTGSTATAKSSLPPPSPSRPRPSCGTTKPTRIPCRPMKLWMLFSSNMSFTGVHRRKSPNWDSSRKRSNASFV